MLNHQLFKPFKFILTQVGLSSDSFEGYKATINMHIPLFPIGKDLANKGANRFLDSFLAKKSFFYQN